MGKSDICNTFSIDTNIKKIVFSIYPPHAIRVIIVDRQFKFKIEKKETLCNALLKNSA